MSYDFTYPVPTSITQAGTRVAIMTFLSTTLPGCSLEFRRPRLNNFCVQIYLIWVDSIDFKNNEFEEGIPAQLVFKPNLIFK